jgi:hypothetical protein
MWLLQLDQGHGDRVRAGLHPCLQRRLSPACGHAPPAWSSPHPRPQPAPPPNQILTIAGSVVAGTIVVAAAIAFGASRAPREARKEDRKNAISKALAASTTKKAQAPKVKSGGCASDFNRPMAARATR